MYSYDPYGQTRTSTSGVANPFQYASYYNDGTGLYHVGARYYDPLVARFTQRDPSGRESNAYAYARNSPCSVTDPAGRSSLSILQACGIGIGGGLVEGFLGALAAVALGASTPIGWALVAFALASGASAGVVGCVTGAVTDYLTGRAGG
jgi:RHS repeat-associated protein